MQSLWCELEWVGRSRNTDEKYYEDSVEYGFQLPSAKLGKGGEGGSEGGISLIRLLAKEDGMYGTLTRYVLQTL